MFTTTLMFLLGITGTLSNDVFRIVIAVCFLSISFMLSKRVNAIFRVPDVQQDLASLRQRVLNLRRNAVSHG